MATQARMENFSADCVVLYADDPKGQWNKIQDPTSEEPTVDDSCLLHVDIDEAIIIRQSVWRGHRELICEVRYELNELVYADVQPRSNLVEDRQFGVSGPNIRIRFQTSGSPSLCKISVQDVASFSVVRPVFKYVQVVISDFVQLHFWSLQTTRALLGASLSSTPGGLLWPRYVFLLRTGRVRSDMFSHPVIPDIVRATLFDNYSSALEWVESPVPMRLREGSSESRLCSNFTGNDDLKDATPSLLNLPVEIRLQILQYVFGQSRSKQLEKCLPISPDAAPRAPVRSSLLHVCRQLYHEALPILYASTLFNVNVGGYSMRFWKIFPPTTVRMIKHLYMLFFPAHLKSGYSSTRDDELPAWIGILVQHCPFLKSLTLRIVHDTSLDWPYSPPMFRNDLGWNDKAATAISELRLPQAFNMTVFDPNGFIPHDTYTDLRHSLAPDARWHTEWSLKLFDPWIWELDEGVQEYYRAWTLARSDEEVEIEEHPSRADIRKYRCNCNLSLGSTR